MKTSLIVAVVGCVTAIAGYFIGQQLGRQSAFHYGWQSGWDAAEAASASARVELGRKQALRAAKEAHQAFKVASMEAKYARAQERQELWQNVCSRFAGAAVLASDAGEVEFAQECYWNAAVAALHRDDGELGIRYALRASNLRGPLVDQSAVLLEKIRARHTDPEYPKILPVPPALERQSELATAERAGAPVSGRVDREIRSGASTTSPASPAARTRPKIDVSRYDSVVYVLDATGSMVDVEFIAKVAVAESIGAIREDQSFHILAVQKEIKAFRFVPGGESRKSKRDAAADFLVNLVPHGPGDPSPAIRRAADWLRSFAGRRRAIVFISDGDWTTPTRGQEDILKDLSLGHRDIVIDTYAYNTSGSPAGVKAMKQVAAYHSGQCRVMD